MPSIRSFIKEIWTIYSVYGQILVVCLAFAVMAISSYLFVGKIMRSQLNNEADATLDFLQSSIETDLLEPEMLLNATSQSIRNFILQGYTPEMVHEYIKDISDTVTKDEKRKLSINGLYGCFDVFGDLFLNDGTWEPAPDFVPQKRPWYEAAVDADGKTVFTEPDIDVHSRSPVVSYYSRRIFEGDRPLGIIGIDVPLDKIAEYVVGTSISKGGYGILLNKDLELIAHPDWGMLGIRLDAVSSGMAIFSTDLEQGKDVFGRTTTNYLNVKCIAFIRQIENGWYVGLVTPTGEYYREVRNMGLVLAALGIALAIVLSVILWQIALARKKTEAESQQKSEFLAKMSHEIRTPMNAILGITEIQLQDQTIREDVREALSKIYNSGDLLLGIINDILDFSKVEAGKMELLPVRYYVASMINDVVQLTKIKYENKPIEFKLEVEEIVPSLLIGDELRIKQILNNLLSNAFKYTDKGEVSLSVSVEYVARGSSTNVNLIFLISDTGQGMTSEQIHKLFDEYSRFNPEANRTTQGTGLGMSITRKLVEMMDGNISVKSTPGKGTTVTVRLPQRNIGAAVYGMVGKKMAEDLRHFRMSSASQTEKAQLIYDPMPYGSILIVDDVETNLYVAKGLMSPYGLSIDTATSGFEAIDKVKGGSVYDIIFMDHMMPKMDGIEAVKIMRGLGYMHPIVALTANALVGQEEMFLNNGFDGFISKPIDVRQLNDSLNKLVRDKQPYEVIEAARRQKAARQTQEKTSPLIAPPSPESFVRDAERVVSTLEIICKNEFRRANDIKIFTITVQSIKGSLANIGETELSAAAFRLEQAGQNQDIARMSAETPEFLQALNEAIKKYTSEGGGIESEDEDMPFLHEKLLIIQAACAIRDKKTAKDALVELKRKTWSRPTKDMLNAVIEYVLQGNFEEAVSLTRDYDSAQFK